MAKEDLAPLVGKCVFVDGVFDGSDLINAPDGRQNKIAIVIHLNVSGDSTDRIWVGHTRVSYAAAIRDANPKRGDKIRFLAEVYSYMARDHATGRRTVLAYGLSNPSDVEIYESAPEVVVQEAAAAAPMMPRTPQVAPAPAPSLPPPSTPRPAPIPPPTQSVTVERTAADTVELLRAVRAVGPDVIRTVLELEKQAGGADFLQRIAELLR